MNIATRKCRTWEHPRKWYGLRPALKRIGSVYLQLIKPLGHSGLDRYRVGETGTGFSFARSCCRHCETRSGVHPENSVPNQLIARQPLLNLFQGNSFGFRHHEFHPDELKNHHKTEKQENDPRPLRLRISPRQFDH